MVYTRAQNSQALASRSSAPMKGRRIHVDHAAPIAAGQSNLRVYIQTPGYRLVKEAPFFEPAPVSPRAVTRASASHSVSSQQMWSSWSTWYASFVSEMEDEGARGSARFSAAEDRWTTFAAKSFRCEEAEVRQWLTSTPASRRLPAAGF
jgi:hypothetical protein